MPLLCESDEKSSCTYTILLVQNSTADSVGNTTTESDDYYVIDTDSFTVHFIETDENETGNEIITNSVTNYTEQ